MENKIGEKLVEVLTNIVNITPDEEATLTRPYAVYSLDTAPTYTKNGVTKISGTLEINIYSDTFNEMDSLAIRVMNAITAGMMNSEFRAIISSSGSSCQEGIHKYKIIYMVAQYRINNN